MTKPQSSAKKLSSRFATRPTLDFWDFCQLLRKSSQAVLLHHHCQAVQIADNAAEGVVQRVELGVDAFPTLFAEETKTNSKTTHGRYDMSFQEVQFRCHVTPLTIHDFPTRSCHKLLYFFLKVGENFIVDSVTP